MESIRIFWTGGWDSTFRVIQLARRGGVRIEPHYIITTGRAGMPQELMALERLRVAITARFPQGAEVLAPLRISLGSQIDSELVAQGERRLGLLRGRVPLGPQYAWLWAYVQQHNLHGMDLCIHRKETRASLGDHVRECSDVAGKNHKVVSDGDEGLELLACFHLPLLGYSKIDMLRIARSDGFLDLMNMTWFCHKPTPNGFACGRCTPCRQTMAEMPERIPAWNRYYGPPLRNRLRHLWYLPMRLVKEADWERGLPGRALRRIKAKG